MMDSKAPPQAPAWEFHTWRETRVELTLNGLNATDLVCWPVIRGAHDWCECEGAKAHLFGGYCAGSINEALGAPKRRHCKKAQGTCKRRHPASGVEVVEALKAWHAASGRGGSTVGRAKAPELRKIKGQSAATAAGKQLLLGSAAVEGRAHDGELPAVPLLLSAFQQRGGRCTVPAELLEARLEKRAASSPYLGRFLAEPFLGPMLADDRLRQLLTARKTPRELTEAYGTADRVAAAVRALGATARGGGGGGGDGEGFVVLDVCSGGGLAAVLVSFLLPRARVVMLDANGGMDLSHVAARPNLAFEPLDLFSGDAPGRLATLAARAARPGWCVAFGVHLCGALSPRLATLACRLPGVGGLVLCPCCLKGGHGSFVLREAAQPRGQQRLGGQR